jgi:large subunit ribosomal protein L21e
MRKRVREKGKLGLSRLLADYKEGERVVIKIDSAIHKGLPHKRYQGKVGMVTGKRGRSYLVEIPFKKKVKTIITPPEHLKKLKGRPEP